jgi:plastocyanin
MRARLLATAAVLACACSGALASAASRAKAPPAIVIDKMAFGPAPKSLRVGQTVTWENRDMFQHSATERGGGFDLVLKPHARGQTKLTRPGRVTVYCRYHPGMTLTLDVAK